MQPTAQPRCAVLAVSACAVLDLRSGGRRVGAAAQACVIFELLKCAEELYCFLVLCFHACHYSCYSFCCLFCDPLASPLHALLVVQGAIFL